MYEYRVEVYRVRKAEEGMNRMAILGWKVIARVEMGDELHVVGMTKDKTWLRVKRGSSYGYVLTDLMSKTPTWKGLIS